MQKLHRAIKLFMHNVHVSLVSQSMGLSENRVLSPIHTYNIYIYIHIIRVYIYIHGIFFITFFFLEGNPTLREMPIKPDKPIFFSRLRGAGACTRTSSLVTGSRSSSPAVASGDLQLDPVGHSR